MEEYPKTLTNLCVSKIFEQMNNCLYKFNKKDGEFETGFFCKIKIKKLIIPVFIINNIVKLKEYKGKIIVSINNKHITIELGDISYQNTDFNMTIIEIKENKKIKINFLEIDDAIYNNESEMYYNKKPIYTIQWNNINDSILSFGTINDINETNIIYTSEINSNSKFSLIFNLVNNKLIGKHERKLGLCNTAKFFQILIKNFIIKYNSNIKHNKLPNEINIIINVDNEDINKQIYFLDNYEDAVKKNFHNNFKELNEKNTELLINNKKYLFKKYFIPEKKGYYNINLKFNINLTDCSYMFAGCINIIKINFISFNTKYVKSMKYMFHKCKYLEFINLFSFNTQNVIDMSHMFSYCENLMDLALVLDFKNIKNMSYMFYNCYSLKNLILPPLDYINNINMDYIIYGCRFQLNYIKELKAFLKLEKPIHEIKKEIIGKYILTTDNFIKIILISIKIKTNIPVIRMGETGCGKTSLIEMVFRLLNNRPPEEMKILNIHAGTSENNIIQFIEKEIINEAIKLQNDDKKNGKLAKEHNINYFPRKLFVLLEEINTCESIGLISELICKHSYQGKALPSNVYFIATCYPYRYYKSKTVNDNNNLVYSVNPLPNSLLKYVFDFGTLHPKDEEKYIENMVEEPIKIANNHLLNYEQFQNIHILVTTLIVKAHNFIRKNNGISSISLRNIKRYNILYKFFFNYLTQKKKSVIILLKKML